MTKDKVIVITGASAGIAAATARRLGRRGASLVLAARREPELTTAAAPQIGVQSAPQSLHLPTQTAVPPSNGAFGS